MIFIDAIVISHMNSVFFNQTVFLQSLFRKILNTKPQLKTLATVKINSELSAINDITRDRKNIPL